MTKENRRTRAVRKIAGGVAILFGLATVKEGGSVLLGDAAALEAAGNYVPFVLWFNFVAGLFYIVAGAGILGARVWARPLAVGITVATLAVFAAFAIHIAAGEPYSGRTIVAMTLRSGLWGGIAAWLGRGGREIASAV